MYLFQAENALDCEEINDCFARVNALCEAGKVRAAWAVEENVAEGIMKMSFGNEIGFTAREDAQNLWYGSRPGAIIAECEGEVEGGLLLGYTTEEPVIRLAGEEASVAELLSISEGVLEEVYPTRTEDSGPVETISCAERAPIVARHKVARPKAVIPVFPGTNCEYDTAAACLRAEIEPEILVVRNLTGGMLAESADALEKAIQSAQMVVLPGGFSGGDEPDGSAKFICSFLRNPRITDAIHDLLKNRDGLMLGICNGFQALVKLGLVPYGEIRAMDENCATLTYNNIGRHQSRYVTTRIASVRSPWMLKSQVGDLHAIPISHGEGRFVAPEALLDQLVANGQVATQYVDGQGVPSMDIDVNPNGALRAIEGIFSPDGRVFGKMGHSERRGACVGKNIPGDRHQPLFESGAAYFK